MQTNGDDHCSPEISYEGGTVKFVFRIDGAWINGHYVPKTKFGIIELKALSKWHGLMRGESKES